MQGRPKEVAPTASGIKRRMIIAIVLVLNAQSTEPAFSPDLKSVSRRESMGIDTSVVRQICGYGREVRHRFAKPRLDESPGEIVTLCPRHMPS